MMNRLNYRGNCVFDVILSDNSVFVMDVIYFNNVDYSESEAESRLFTVTSRVVFPWFVDFQLSEDNYFLLYQDRRFPIIPIPYSSCDVPSLLSFYSWNANIPLNGLLFVEYGFSYRSIVDVSVESKKEVPLYSYSGKILIVLSISLILMLLEKCVIFKKLLYS